MEDVAIVSAGSATEAKDYPTWMSVDHAAHFQAIKDAFPNEAEELCNRTEPLQKRDLLAIYDRAVIKLGEGNSRECSTSRERSPQSETGESDLELHANEDFPSEDGRETEVPSKAKRSKMEDSLTGNELLGLAKSGKIALNDQTDLRMKLLPRIPRKKISFSPAGSDVGKKRFDPVAHMLPLKMQHVKFDPYGNKIGWELGSLPKPPRSKGSLGLAQCLELGIEAEHYPILMRRYLTGQGIPTKAQTDELLEREFLRIADASFTLPWHRTNLRVLGRCEHCGSTSHASILCYMVKNKEARKRDQCNYCRGTKGESFEHTVKMCKELHGLCFKCKRYGHGRNFPNCPRDEAADQERWEHYAKEGLHTRHERFTYKPDVKRIAEEVEEVCGSFVKVYVATVRENSSYCWKRWQQDKEDFERRQREEEKRKQRELEEEQERLQREERRRREVLVKEHRSAGQDQLRKDSEKPKPSVKKAREGSDAIDGLTMDELSELIEGGCGEQEHRAIRIRAVWEADMERRLQDLANKMELEREADRKKAKAEDDALERLAIEKANSNKRTTDFMDQLETERQIERKERREFEGDCERKVQDLRHEVMDELEGIKANIGNPDIVLAKVERLERVFDKMDKRVKNVEDSVEKTRRREREARRAEREAKRAREAKRVVNSDSEAEVKGPEQELVVEVSKPEADVNDSSLNTECVISTPKPTVNDTVPVLEEKPSKDKPVKQHGSQKRKDKNAPNVQPTPEHKPVEELPKSEVKTTSRKKKDSDELLLDVSVETLKATLGADNVGQASEDLLDAVVANTLDGSDPKELLIFQADGFDPETLATDVALAGMDSLMETGLETEMETSFERIAEDFNEDDGRDYEGMNPE
jgi:hypothetical protein